MCVSLHPVLSVLCSISRRGKPGEIKEGAESKTALLAGSLLSLTEMIKASVASQTLVPAAPAQPPVNPIFAEAGKKVGHSALFKIVVVWCSRRYACVRVEVCDNRCFNNAPSCPCSQAICDLCLRRSFAWSGHKTSSAIPTLTNRPTKRAATLLRP